jgi:hypothetical protein
MAGGGGLQGRWRGCTLASGGTWHLHDKQGEKVKAGSSEEFLEENEGEQVSSATYVEEEWAVRELLAVGENEDGGGNLAFIDDEGRGGAWEGAVSSASGAQLWWQATACGNGSVAWNAVENRGGRGADRWGPRKEIHLKNFKLIQLWFGPKATFQSSKNSNGIWGNNIWKDEQLLPLDILHIRDGNWIKNLGSQDLFLS